MRNFQKRVEDIVQESYDSFKARGPIDKQCLFHRNHHVNYLMKSLKSVPSSYVVSIQFVPWRRNYDVLKKKTISPFQSCHAEFKNLRKNLDVFDKPFVVESAFLSLIVVVHQTLDASRTWICFWSLNGLRILDAEILEETQKDIIRFIKSCEDPEGGYGGLDLSLNRKKMRTKSGGPGQSAHLAPTYAAVMALVLLKSEEALKSIDR